MPFGCGTIDFSFTASKREKPLWKQSGFVF
jgi:hypothetical protein